MTTFNATPILGGNTTARIKLPDLPDGKQYTAKCGTSGHCCLIKITERS